MDEMKWWPSNYDYDPKITKEIWLKLLDDRSIFYESNLHIFACFYDYGGVATCTELANKYGGTANTYLNGAVGIAKRIVNAGYCEKIDLGDEHSKYWPVLFVGHQAEKGNEGVYVWKIRDELMEALKEYGIEKWLDVINESSFRELIIQYKRLLYDNKKVALDDEKYKWELITNCKNIPLQKFVELAVKENVSAVQWANGLRKVVEEKTDDFQNILNNLFDENRELHERLSIYKEEMKTLYTSYFSDVLVFNNDERMASVFLTCKFPNRYTFYKDSYYQKFCKYLNVKSKKAGEKYEHYLYLINQLLKFVEEDAKLINEIESELAGLEKSSLLIAQNIVYTLLEEDNLNMDGVSKIDDYVNLLKSNHNIILHGAPGTGKTYLAKEIAKSMGADEENIGFVQFHPSYDYTDFVEGLRPKKEGVQIGFERKDGVFKEFCGRALENMLDSKKSTEEIRKEKTIQKVYNELLFRIRNGEISELLQRTGISIKILEITENDNLVFKTKDSEVKSTYTVSLARLLKLAEVFVDKEALQNIKNIDKEIRAVIGGCHSSSYWATLNWIYENSNLLDDTPNENTNNTERKNFIFIIDEINRGEISKIFGELFFSIDPGYRGEKGLVQTQYQNLVEEGDIFKKGFFVPENVYIIGTMNDIDRSVESMDFAMRRRFVFKEITAAESAENMSLGDEANRRMTALNDAISRIDGLSSSYHIGAAYFLKDGVTISEKEDFDELWELRLESLLTEYLRGTGNESKLKYLKNAYEQSEQNLSNSESDE